MSIFVMSVIVIVFLFLALLHFVYEGIIAPSIRLSLRYRLFSVRDELRELKIIHSDAVDEDIYRYLEDTVNNSISLLPRLNLEAIWIAETAFDNDKSLQSRVKKRLALLDKCPVQEVKEIRNKCYDVLNDALIANSGAWFIYVLPIILLAFCFSHLKKLSQKVVSAPQHDMDKIFHNHHALPA